MRKSATSIQHVPLPCAVIQSAGGGSFYVAECNAGFLEICENNTSAEVIKQKYPKLFSAFLDCLAGNSISIVQMRRSQQVFQLSCKHYEEQHIICFQDISSLQLSSVLAEKLMQTTATRADYSEICESILQLSGAEFCTINLIESDGISRRIRAVSGSQRIAQQMMQSYGHHPLGQIWTEAVEGFMQHEIQKVKISSQELELGDFTLFNCSSEFSRNSNLIQRIAHQLALMLLHSRSEHELSCFRSIFNNASYGIVITDLESNIRFSNNYYAKLHGYLSEELIGTLISDLYSDQINTKERVVKRNGASALEIWHKHRDGHMFPMMVSGAVIPSEDGLPKHIVLTALDLTEQYQVELSLQEAIEDAYNASMAKSSFLASMSHEIRTPLNSIIGFARLLEAENPQQNEYAQNILRSSGILLQLVDDILDFSKIEAGKLELHTGSLELKPFLQSLVDALQPQAADRSNSLRLEIGPGVPAVCIADELRLRQVLINLLSNAIKFTDQGEIRLLVEALAGKNPETAHLRFSVIDTGIGIAADQQADIFESFVQADPSTTRKYGGTGLGLPISNRILALMNSKLNLKSTPGKGSRFFFSLRLEILEIGHESEEISPGNGTEHPCVETGCSMFSVLLVDDDRVNRVLARVLMQRILPGAEIYEADNGMRALEMFSEQQPDIVLLDIQMPGMDGYDTSREMRKMEAAWGQGQSAQPKSVIIALTANTMSDTMKHCLAAGMDGYSPKPVNEQDLQGIILQHTSDSNRL